VVKRVKLEGQVAIVTGAGRNIGEEICKLLASEGARIAVVDLDQGRAELVAADIRNDGGAAIAVVANIAVESDVQTMVKTVAEKWGRIDILVNNAANTNRKNVLDISKAEWDAVLAVTLTGPFLVTKYVAAQMIAEGHGGKVVVIGSTSGFLGRANAIAYSAAKGGVANLTRALAIQLAPHDIRVTGLVPNKIGSPVGEDDFDPSRPVVNLRNRTGIPQDVARAVLFLVSDDSDFVVGTMLYVDGGVSAIAP
jgi:NAD(P)-dependent dehydrogenase (short-subunit alcohol dehydrogenase family)